MRTRARQLIKEDAINGLLREHVLRVGFDLTLTKTQIAAMVWINHAYIEKKAWRSPKGRPWSHFVTGARGLTERGLVWHDPPRSPQEHGKKQPYGFTSAGELVKSLLIEAGIWQEYQAKLEGDLGTDS